MKVSVILPSLNVAGYIRECLRSVVSQTLEGLEFICVDAGSTDGTWEALEEFAEKDGRVHLIRSSVKSYGKQVNLGLDMAKGEYVAVLETDDYVDSAMYETLYARAVGEGLDYAAADYDSFCSLRNGKRCFTRAYLFGEHGPWYGKVLDAGQIAGLMAADYLLWKGIYRRDFLEKNGIRLHESRGAAYQDMGFLMQVKAHASRAVYLDRSFYRYRMDRPEASTYHMDGLIYYQQEFSWMEDALGFPARMDGVHRQNYYSTMAHAFLGKYDQLLKVVGYDYKDERLLLPYQWFRDRFSGSAGLPTPGSSAQEAWHCEELQLLLRSQREHMEWLSGRERIHRCKMQEFLKRIGSHAVTIFGCGRRGRRLLLFCDRHGVKVEGFCDNAPAHHGEKCCGFAVFPPSQLKARVEKGNGAVLLSMKEGTGAVYGQILGMGIHPSRVIKDIPWDIL